MMGLFDGLFNMDQRTALSLLSAAGPSREPSSFGQRLFAGLMQADQMKAQEEERKQKQALQQMQMGLMQAQIGETEAQAKQRMADVEKRKGIETLLGTVLGGQAAPSQYGVGGSGINLGGVQEPMVPRQGGLGGASIEDVTKLKALAGIDVLDHWKAAQTGLKQEAGNYYVRGGKREYVADPTKGLDFANGRVSLIPGALESQAAMTGAVEGAKEEAKAPYTLVDAFVDGRPGKVPLADFLGPKRRPEPSPLVPPLAPAASRNSNPMEMARAEAVSTGAPVAFNLGGQRGSFDSGGNERFIQTGPSTQQRASAEAISLGNQTFMKDQFPGALDAGKAADQIIIDSQSARNAMRNLGTTGWGTPTVAAAASVLGRLGVPQAEKYATNAQQFQQAAMSRLWTTLNAAKGPQTEGDADRAGKTFARLQDTTQKNMFVIDLTQAQAERDRLRAQFYRDAYPIAAKEGDLQRIEREWAKVAPSIWSMPLMKKWGANE